VLVCPYLLAFKPLFSEFRLDDEITQLQQQINSMDALRATSNSYRNRTSQTATEVGLILELFSLQCTTMGYPNQ
jgi:hypothetical protein